MAGGLEQAGRSTLNVITPVQLADVGIGGGPIIPPEGGGGGGEQPPSDAHPEHPIYFPPQVSHPIVLPPEVDIPEFPTPPIEIPPEVSDNPHGFEMTVGWTEETGWAVVFVPTGDHVAPSAA